MERQPDRFRTNRVKFGDMGIMITTWRSVASVCCDITSASRLTILEHVFNVSEDQAYEMSVNTHEKLKPFRIVGHNPASVVSCSNTFKLDATEISTCTGFPE